MYEHDTPDYVNYDTKHLLLSNHLSCRNKYDALSDFGISISFFEMEEKL